MDLNMKDQLNPRMLEIYELMIERDTLETKGIDNLDDYQLDRYYSIKNRLNELFGGNENVQRNIEIYLEKRFRRGLSS